MKTLHRLFRLMVAVLLSTQVGGALAANESCPVYATNGPWIYHLTNNTDESVTVSSPRSSWICWDWSGAYNPSRIGLTVAPKEASNGQILQATSTNYWRPFTLAVKVGTLPAAHVRMAVRFPTVDGGTHTLIYSPDEFLTAEDGPVIRRSLTTDDKGRTIMISFSSEPNPGWTRGVPNIVYMRVFYSK